MRACRHIQGEVVSRGCPGRAALRAFERSEDGVSIVFACLLLLVLMVVGGIILSYGYSNYTRSVESVAQEQSRLTVESGANVLAAKVGSTSVGANGTVFTADSGAADPDASRVAASLLNSSESSPVTVSVSDFGTVNAAVTNRPTSGLGGNYELTCWEDGTTSGQLSTFTLTVSGSGSTYNVEAKQIAREAYANGN